MPRLVVISGGTGFNPCARSLQQRQSQRQKEKPSQTGVSDLHVTHVLPVSDDGGSSRELTRVFGGCAIGDIRSRLVRLAASHTASMLLARNLSASSGAAPSVVYPVRALRSILEHRIASREDWASMLDLSHPLCQPLLIEAEGTVSRAEIDGFTISGAHAPFVSASAELTITLMRLFDRFLSVRETFSTQVTAPLLADPATTIAEDLPCSLGAALVVSASADTLLFDDSSALFPTLTPEESISAAVAAVEAVLASDGVIPYQWEPDRPFTFAGGSVGNYVLTALRLLLGGVERAVAVFSALIGVPISSSVVPACLPIPMAPCLPEAEPFTIAAVLSMAFTALSSPPTAIEGVLRASLAFAPPVTLSARLQDGTVLVGQCAVSHPLPPPAGEGAAAASAVDTAGAISTGVKDAAHVPLSSPIDCIYLSVDPYPPVHPSDDVAGTATGAIPAAAAAPVECSAAVAAVAAADVVVFSMGSLFTSVAAAAAAPGVATALTAAAAETAAQTPAADSTGGPSSAGACTTNLRRRVLILNCGNDRETFTLRPRAYVAALSRCVAAAATASATAAAATAVDAALVATTAEAVGAGEGVAVEAVQGQGGCAVDWAAACAAPVPVEVQETTERGLITDIVIPFAPALSPALLDGALPMTPAAALAADGALSSPHGPAHVLAAAAAAHGWLARDDIDFFRTAGTQIVFAPVAGAVKPDEATLDAARSACGARVLGPWGSVSIDARALGAAYDELFPSSPAPTFKKSPKGGVAADCVDGLRYQDGALVDVLLALSFPNE